ncbi:MAG: DUF3179 domain-containing (seleno)protein, partial [Chitinophagales bacterium]
NVLKKLHTINDTIGNTSVVLWLENDNMSFHVFNRKISDQLLSFAWSDSTHSFVDSETHSLWNYDGECVDGELKGNQLSTIPAYQEFWQSWKTFHPNSHVFTPGK